MGKNKGGEKMNFIKISISENLEQIINIDNIVQLIKGEDYIEREFLQSYTLIMKNCAPMKITEKVYNQIKSQIGF